MIRQVLILVLITLQAICLSGQGVTLDAACKPADKAFYFKNYTTRDGLPHGLVNLIFEDRHGFLWLSTLTGLARYDGFSFRPILGEGSGCTETFSPIISMAEDSSGKIWATATDGVMISLEGLSNNYFSKKYQFSAQLPTFSSILKIDRDKIWLITREGIKWYFFKSKKLVTPDWPVPILENEAMRRFGAPQIIFSGIPDGQDGAWLIGKNDKTTGVFHWNISKNAWKFYPYSDQPGHRELAQTPGFLWEDRVEHYIYAGGWSGGLRRLNPATDRWETFDFKSFGKETIHQIAVKNERELWICTELGISVFDKKTFESEDWAYDASNLNSILPYRIACCCVRRSGAIWFGGQSGVSCIDPAVQMFPRRNILPPGEDVGCHYKDTLYHRAFWGTNYEKFPRCRIFCAEEGLGLDKARIVYDDPNAKYEIYFILRDKTGKGYWVGTSTRLLFMDAKTFKVTPVREKVMGSDTLSTDKICCRMASYDNQGNLWIGTYAQGIIKLDGRSGKCSQWLPHKTGDRFSLEEFSARSVFCDQNGRIWAGSLNTDGIGVYDAQRGVDLCLDTTVAWRTYFYKKSVFGFAEDKFGKVWAATIKGLVRCQFTKSGVFSAEKYAKINEAVYYVAFDEQGRLWMKTNSGIQCLDPVSGELLIFNEKNSISADFSFGRMYKADDGEFFFGGNYRWRNSDILSQKAATPLVSITAVSLFDKLIDPVKWSAPGQSLQLSYAENALVFEFSALNMNQPAECQYHWRLHGQTPLHTTDGAPGEHRATFNNLPPGDYQFEVWADGHQNDSKSNPKAGDSTVSSTILQFHIEPPFWATWWFRSLAGALVVSIAYLFYKNRLKIATASAKIQQQKAELQQKDAEYGRSLAEMEIASLRAQMNPHFLFNSLGTLEAFIMEQRTDEATVMLHKFSRLTRMVLENSARPLVPLEDDLAALRLYIELEQIRFQNAFRVEWELDEAMLDENLQIPPLLVQPFVENAILHGLRNKISGEKFLKITLRKEDKSLVFIIEDNGVGRDQARQISKQKMPGQTSLGGKLTLRRIELLNRTLQTKAKVQVRNLYENEADTGTHIELRLPVN